MMREPNTVPIPAPITQNTYYTTSYLLYPQQQVRALCKMKHLSKRKIYTLTKFITVTIQPDYNGCPLKLTNKDAVLKN
jgi:hypothetical protein